MEGRLPLVRLICICKAWPQKTCLWFLVGPVFSADGTRGSQAAEGKKPREAAEAGGSAWQRAGSWWICFLRTLHTPGSLGGSSWHSHSCFLLWIYGLVFFWAPTEWCILIGEAQSLPLVFSEVIKRDMSPEKSVQGGMDMPTGKGRTWSMWLFDKGAKTEAEERWLLHGAGWGRCGRLRSSFTLHKNQFKAEQRPKYKTWNIETAGG